MRQHCSNSLPSMDSEERVRTPGVACGPVLTLGLGDEPI